jgi:hypothetical protein
MLQLQIGHHRVVQVDAAFRAVLVNSLDEYRTTVGPGTWRAVMKYAEELKQFGTSVAFFSSTPQGGGVALMRHALMRFFHVLGLKVSW